MSERQDKDGRYEGDPLCGEIVFDDEREADDELPEIDEDDYSGYQESPMKSFLTAKNIEKALGLD